jgi:hypothetical protein
MAYFTMLSMSEDEQRQKSGSSVEKELEDTWKGALFT